MRRQPFRFTRASSLLRGAAVIALTTVAAIGGPGAAFAEDPTTPPAGGGGAAAGANPNLGPKTAGTPVCTLTSSTLTQISGVIATAQNTMVVQSINDTTLKIYTLDATCRATPKTYTGVDPLAPEDMAMGANGTIWVGDIGDPDGNRRHIAVHKIAAGGSTAVVNRMAYTDGNKSASAFLIDGDDLPVILANVSGKPGVTLYKPDKALVPNTQENLPNLTNVGEFVPEKTGTSNPTAESQVTGAAKSADGTKVVIRTLADAYEWAVPDGDVVKAITKTKPVITPLPDEPQGEAITYTADGKFLTVGFKPTGATENAKLLTYTPFVPAAVPDGGTDPGGGGAPTTSSEQSWLSKLKFAELTRVVAAVGVVGLVLAIAGIIGIRRARKRRREEEDEYDEYDEYDERPRRGRPGGGGATGYGPRDPQYDNQYGAGYADPGYGAANGYGANGYPDPAYGQPAAANGYGAQEQYGAEAYGQQYEGQYGPQEYGGQAGYDGYGQPQYGADQYGADQYGAQPQYGADQYGADQYADPHGAPAPQQYGDYGGQGQQYGGYGYDEFDPTHDPRRR